MVKLLICPSKDLAKNAVVGSILEYIVGTLAHWADHLLKSRWSEILHLMKSIIEHFSVDTIPVNIFNIEPAKIKLRRDKMNLRLSLRRHLNLHHLISSGNI